MIEARHQYQEPENYKNVSQDGAGDPPVKFLPDHKDASETQREFLPSVLAGRDPLQVISEAIWLTDQTRLFLRLVITNRAYLTIPSESNEGLWNTQLEILFDSLLSPGLSQEEHAENLGLDKRTVRTQNQRTVRLLCDNLQPVAIDPNSISLDKLLKLANARALYDTVLRLLAKHIQDGMTGEQAIEIIKKNLSNSKRHALIMLEANGFSIGGLEPLFEQASVNQLIKIRLRSKEAHDLAGISLLLSQITGTGFFQDETRKRDGVIIGLSQILEGLQTRGRGPGQLLKLLAMENIPYGLASATVMSGNNAGKVFKHYFIARQHLVSAQKALHPLQTQLKETFEESFIEQIPGTPDAALPTAAQLRSKEYVTVGKNQREQGVRLGVKVKRKIMTNSPVPVFKHFYQNANYYYIRATDAAEFGKYLVSTRRTFKVKLT